LKLESCKLTYPPILKETGKEITIKEEYRNNIGISGGVFTKTDIFMSIIENLQYDDYWFRHCKVCQGDILSIKTIPKPYDLNDAFTIFKYLKNPIKLI
jgi:hypothetical protein